MKYKTDYQKSWEKFKKSRVYHQDMTALFEKGILHPFSSNILQSAFDAGYNENLQEQKRIISLIKSRNADVAELNTIIEKGKIKNQ
jgi:hypothetical protein